MAGDKLEEGVSCRQIGVLEPPFKGKSGLEAA
jgi:hypothetical protein